MKTYEGCIDRCILDLGITLWVVSFTPRPLYSQGKSHVGACWIGGWVGPRISGEGGDDKILLLPELELRPLGPLAHSYSLYLLHYPSPLTVYVLRYGVYNGAPIAVIFVYEFYIFTDSIEA
jgi:hypothetical protein